MRIGVDVGGTNTDAVLIDGDRVIATTKGATTADVSSGVSAAIERVLADAAVLPEEILWVMIGTTQFTNALVERDRLDRVGVLRLASPSGDALPPMTAWPRDLIERIGGRYYMLPGGFEVDGREIAPIDEHRIRVAARELRDDGIRSIAISSAFSPIDPAMELRAAAIVAEEHHEARISLSHEIGRLGLVERENGVILNAALMSLAATVVASFERAIDQLGLTAPLFISQNDGTLIPADRARRYPVVTMASGPTNSMRGAAYLTGAKDAIVVDVGGTTCDIGVLVGGFPRESSISVDVGGVRTNFRMPDILAVGLGGGSRVHFDPAAESGVRIGPDSVGYRIVEEGQLFGGKTLTASDIAALCGRVGFGDPSRILPLPEAMRDAAWARIEAMVAEGVDRMKTTATDCDVIAVGGGEFLVGENIPGVARVLRPANAAVANAVGAAIAQIGGHVEQVVDYDVESRDEALARLSGIAIGQVVSNGGDVASARIVDIDEVFLSYLPGRSAQVRIRAVGDLALVQSKDKEKVALGNAD
ncbi:hydantoinase/oxoprolinase family protein [Croceicoccus ponticola]|uniref:Hydantoinase/oxoprolinase family protein n=1 Tax=Croceicoccus ponticola TaxID=2217664 RepID=A0A437GW91_9SPHN|nr:hydantoinase/oxoprolinase family protein [Croceicoccus ponticola]RVQ66367.1 hydantoinase/oxoprolinase family protein [Croceicoccus ponticola]